MAKPAIWHSMSNFGRYQAGFTAQMVLFLASPFWFCMMKEVWKTSLRVVCFEDILLLAYQRCCLLITDTGIVCQISFGKIT